MKNALLLFATAILFTACQKDLVDPTNTPTTTNTTNNGSGDYYPLAAGNTWQYSSTSYGNYTNTILDKDTLIEGKKYFVVTASNTPGHQYLNKTGPVYTFWGSSIGGISAKNYVLLKEGPVGTIWSSSIDVPNAINTYDYKTEALGLTRIVNGKAYKNVMQLSTKISMTSPLFGSTPIDAGSMTTYYAKGVGIIESVSTVSVLTTSVTDTVRLVAYKVK